MPEEEFENQSVGKRTKGRIRKIVVDRSACIGARSCEVVEDRVFKVDDENLAYVVEGDIDAVEEDSILLAAQSCPVLAIHLYDEDGNKIFPEE